MGQLATPAVLFVVNSDSNYVNGSLGAGYALAKRDSVYLDYAFYEARKLVDNSAINLSVAPRVSAGTFMRPTVPSVPQSGDGGGIVPERRRPTLSLLATRLHLLQPGLRVAGGGTRGRSFRSRVDFAAIAQRRSRERTFPLPGSGESAANVSSRARTAGE